MKNSPNGGGLSRKHIISAVESSLERLQTHYIDLYQVHAFDAGTPLKVSYRKAASVAALSLSLTVCTAT